MQQGRQQAASVYLQSFNFDFYLQELCARLQGRGANAAELELLADFFGRLADGTHVQHRNFAYVTATPLNRKAFVHWLRNALSVLPMPPDSMSCTVRDFHDMLVEMCPDFPLQMVEDAARLSSVDKEEELCRVGETTAQLENDTEAAVMMPEAEPGWTGPAAPRYVMKSLHHNVELIFLGKDGADEA
mmetsp:Transcript_41281/g.74642  ORF Transcript_41281/g.74642 Transcript_41281/m.74642 type:complete len:187 (+) Transcript_41281:52-612(+)